MRRVFICTSGADNLPEDYVCRVDPEVGCGYCLGMPCTEPVLASQYIPLEELPDDENYP